jgi:hypothetical protein
MGRLRLIQPEIDVGDLPARHDDGGRPLGDLAAEIEHGDAVHQSDERVDDMLDPDDGDALRAHHPQRRDQILALCLGETAGDLVQQQQGRAGRQRAGQFQAFALQQRQAAGQRIGFA